MTEQSGRPAGVGPAPAAPRSRALAFALLLGGSLIALGVAGQNWWTLPAGPAVTGNQATDTLAGVLAGAAAAGATLTLLLRSIGRRLLGVVLAALAVAMISSGVAAEPAANPATLPGAGAPQATGMQLAYVAAGVLVAVGALLMVVRAHTWPVRPDRFSRSARVRGVRAEDDAGAVWKALDQGFDPTAPDTDDTSGQKAGDQGE